ncbi:phosphoglycerate mutase-like protein 4 isoform X2 [Morus notabilis]|uniref:phosphoglycerate mutase-like protein 4 isoform X2 n=1 Tax=Morus notabilis TaxID=981085 RepID=UPI000CED2EEF|nr:phosphoglycerate mutase-like protein 4 isoform X2 [Morus notabilis]
MGSITENFSMFDLWSSDSHFFGFSAAQPFLAHNDVAPSLTLTHRSTRLLSNAGVFMALVDPDSSYDNPDYVEVIIVRHGETAWNADGRIQGHLDVELNDAGRQQAAAVADRLSKEPNISAIYSSDLKRALETAEIIATGCGGLEVIKDTGLRERHLGDLQGLVFRDAMKVCPEAYEAFVSPRKDQEIPGGGESRDQLYQRCTSSLRGIGRKHKGQRMILVTHGGFIRTLYKWACPNEKSPGKILNTSVNVFRLADGDKWTLEVWGDVSHLEETGYLQSGFGGDRTSG